MLQAKNQNGMLITLMNRTRQELKQLKKEGSFYCPTCHHPVFMKIGEKMIPHFAHYSIRDCPANERGEGIYHEQGKYFLYQWLKSQGLDTQLEVYISAIQQRPDILLKINQKYIAFEYQCARISADEMLKRNEGYHSIGITPIWILGANRLQRFSNVHFKADAFIQQSIHQFSSDLPSVIYFFCPNTFQFTIIQDIIFTNRIRAIGKIKIKDIRKLVLNDLFSFTPFQDDELWTIWKKEKERFRTTPRKKAYGKELAWRQWLYEKGISMDSLPSIVYLPIQSQLLMKSNLWDWQSRICIDLLMPLPMDSIIPLQRIHHFMKKQVESPALYPLIRSNQDPIHEYIQVLVQLGYLTELPHKIYKKCLQISLYHHIEEAVKGDDDFIKKLLLKNKMQA